MQGFNSSLFKTKKQSTKYLSAQFPVIFIVDSAFKIAVSQPHCSLGITWTSIFPVSSSTSTLVSLAVAVDRPIAVVDRLVAVVESSQP